MSINVTVTGNPISIKRGKMVTCDPNHGKKEFDKRRLMRLEQVRQQSKDIAEDVRNKVRKEKKKQMNEIEEEGKEKLKSWQNRKLLELQTQYKEAIRELGTGHKQAADLEEGESELMAAQQEYDRVKANHRSQVAATHLQMEKEKKQLKKSVPIQHKKIARDVEKTRAALVSNMKKKNTDVGEPNSKKTKRRRASADINITIPDSDSESGEDGAGAGGYADIDAGSIEECECTEDSEEPRQPLNINRTSDSRCPYQDTLQDFRPELSNGRTSPYPRDTQIRTNIRDLYREADPSTSPKQLPVDTRISDRIRRRDIMASQPDYCDIVAETHPIPILESNTKIRDAIDSRLFKKSGAEGFCPCEKGQTVCSSTCGKGLRNTYSDEDIPSKPPVKLIHDSQDKLEPGKSRVDKITIDSLEVIPNVTSEAEWQEKIRQRDRDARIRGQKALEKERIQKDYEDMMKRLPLLQKKERISQITRDKPKYHMGEERLREIERERQNKLDNAYSKLFPNFKPAVVTLPKSKKPEEVKKYADDESVQSINVGKWDVDHEQKMFTAEEVQEIVRAFTEQEKPKDRQAKLKDLLKGLKLQKEQLLEEIKTLPKDDSINQLINDLNSFSDSDEKAKIDDKLERKRRREEEKEASGDSTAESSSTSLTKSKNDKPKKGRRPESAKVPPPRKKAKLKSKRKVLVLQNTSTQTTPKVGSNVDEAKETKEYPTCSKLHVPCDCNKENEKSTEDLCQILIKLNDDKEPEVVVKSKEKESKDGSRTKRVSSAGKKVKSVAVGTDYIEMELPQVSRTVEAKKVSTKSKSESRTTGKSRTTESHVESKKSWKDQLSKNSISTASTSYYSPPDFEKFLETQPTSTMSKESFYNLRKKPQQSNVHELSAAASTTRSRSRSSKKTIEPELLQYIKKLLSRSRDSIENLTASSSNVQTPSQSVIEMDSNNPLAQLHNIIKYYNLKTEDIARELSCSPDRSPCHYNTSASSSGASRQSKGRKKKRSTTSDKETSLNSASTTSKGATEKRVLLQYAQITDSCSKRIATLAAMIDQIREEKVRMLDEGPGAERSTLSDRERSTAYLDLPESKESSRHSSLNSLDDEELHKRLMEIDLSLARKLRKFSPPRDNIVDRDRNAEARDTSRDATDQSSSTDKELWHRLNRLMRKDNEGPRASSTSTESNKETNLQFVPFLSDIPKLPKLEIQIECDSFGSNHKRPPPSKGLNVVKKFNGNISLIPHELSTIIEADSQMSTKLGSNQVSPNASKASQVSSPRKELQLLVRPEEDDETQTSYHSASSKTDGNTHDIVTKISITSKKSPSWQVEVEKTRGKGSKATSPLNMSCDISSKSIVLDGSGSKSTMSKKSIVLSSSSSEDMEAIETMLKSIGMEWAIPTVHKTQEALALTSSSSSLDISSKKTGTASSEVSLKEYLHKQVLNKVSSSTLRSDASPASLLSEFSELSSIHVSSREKKDNQRTSTPLTGSKSTSKSRGSCKQVVFSGDSDISSVKDDSRKHSEKFSYCSLSEYSVSKND